MISLRSGVTKKLLNYFFINPDGSLYVNELARKLVLDKRNLVKKIRELEKEGILESQIRGNLRLYSINKDYALYNEFRRIVIKTTGFEDRLRKIIKDTKNAKEAYLYGSYASNKMDAHSDIDLLVVGSHNIISLQRKLSAIQREIDREINTVNMDEREFKKRILNKDPFIRSVLNKKHIKIAL